MLANVRNDFHAVTKVNLEENTKRAATKAKLEKKRAATKAKLETKRAATKANQETKRAATKAKI